VDDGNTIMTQEETMPIRRRKAGKPEAPAPGNKGKSKADLDELESMLDDEAEDQEEAAEDADEEDDDEDADEDEEESSDDDDEEEDDEDEDEDEDAEEEEAPKAKAKKSKVPQAKKAEDDEDEDELPTVGGWFETDRAAVNRKVEEMKQRRRTTIGSSEGLNYYRVLPPWSKAGLWFKEYLTHWGEGEGDERTANSTCPRTYGKQCLLCQVAQKYNVKDQMGKVRFLVNTVYYGDLTEKKPGDPKRVVVWEFGEGIMNDLLSLQADPDVGDFFSPKRGCTIKVIRTGMGLATRYKVSKREGSRKPLEHIDVLKSQMKDLDRVPPQPDLNVIKERAKALMTQIKRKRLVGGIE
jgi:hypothetical protein